MAVKMTATTTTTGQAASIPVRAGVVGALARGGASTVAFATTFSSECTKPRKEEALYGNADDEATLL